MLQGGKKETVEPLTVEDLHKLHSELFVPENILVTVFGDIDPDEDLKTLAENYSIIM